MLTFKAACPTPEDSEYHNFVTMLGAMELALQNRLILKKRGIFEADRQGA
jgi:hypothetical protein